jgi:hypothetical protein
MTGHYMAVSFDWPRPPLSMNQRIHRMQEAKLTAMVRKAAAEAFATFPPVSKIDVVMTWTVKDRRKRDVENPVATLKPLCDGLVDAGIVPDDTPDLMVKHMPVIRYIKGAVPDVQLVVREIGPEGTQ